MSSLFGSSLFGASKSGSRQEVTPAWSIGRSSAPGSSSPTEKKSLLTPTSPVDRQSPAHTVDVQRLIQDAMVPIITEACKNIVSDTRLEMQALAASMKQDVSRALDQLKNDLDPTGMLSDIRLEMQALVTSMKQDFSRATGQLNGDFNTRDIALQDTGASCSTLSDDKAQHRPDLKDGQATQPQSSIVKTAKEWLDLEDGQAEQPQSSIVKTTNHHSGKEEAHDNSNGDHPSGRTASLNKEGNGEIQKVPQQDSEQVLGPDRQLAGSLQSELPGTGKNKTSIEVKVKDAEKPRRQKQSEKESDSEDGGHLAEPSPTKHNGPSPALPMQLQDIDDFTGMKVTLTESTDAVENGRDKKGGEADEAAGGPRRMEGTCISWDVAQTTPSTMKYNSDTEDPGMGYRHARLSLGLEAARVNEKKKNRIQKEWHELRPRDILESTKFDNAIGCVILINAVVMGYQTDYMARNRTDQMPVWCQIFERFFLVIFTCELALRISVYKCYFFCMKDGRLWNWFDSFCVGAQLTEEIMVIIKNALSEAEDDASMEGGGQMRLMRILRILRIMRILRVVRVLRLISELRTIVSSILGSMKSLAWTIVLLLLMIYIVGVYFTQSVTDHRIVISDELSVQDEEAQDNNALLAIYFGNIPRTLLSLYQAMSGGLDWDTLAHPLFLEISPVVGITFVCYIAFSILALLNVVTGVFVQTALLSAKDEEDNFLTDQVISVFNSSNNETATLTWDDMNEAVEDPDAAAFWKSINVRPEEAGYLFRLLDLDGSGSVEFEEFLGACLRLHGQSKSIDLLTIMQEFRGFVRRFATFEMSFRRDGCMHGSNALEDSVKNVHNCVTELIEKIDKGQSFMRSLKPQLLKVERLQDKIETSQRDMTICVSQLSSLADLLKETGMGGYASGGVDLLV